MKKSYLLIYCLALITLLIGYATIETSLEFTGNSSISRNLENYDVTFSGASLDNIDVFDEITNNTNTIMTFEMGTFLNQNDEHTLTYRVNNNSSMYDAKVKVSCDIPNNISSTMTNSLANTSIPAKSSMDGVVTIKINQNLSSGQSFTCTATTIALERTEESTDEAVKMYSFISSLYTDDSTYLKRISNAINSQYPILYYYGNSDNNAIFGNMCFKIIKTTVNGGIKLIYNGLPSDGMCNNTNSLTILNDLTEYNDDDTTRVDYVYNNGSSVDSKAKYTVDSWYMDKIDREGLTNRISDEIYCNDMNKTSNTFNSYTRLITGNNPTYSCDQEYSYTLDSNLGNGLLQNKVGLLSADEVKFSMDTNSISYLNSGVSYWTMTPYSCDSQMCKMFGVNESGQLSSFDLDQEIGIRPVITLKNDTLKLKGVGSVSNPYVLK